MSANNKTNKIKELTFGAYNKMFKPIKKDYDWTSLSEKLQKIYQYYFYQGIKNWLENKLNVNYSVK